MCSGERLLERERQLEAARRVRPRSSPSTLVSASSTTRGAGSGTTGPISSVSWMPLTAFGAPGMPSGRVMRSRRADGLGQLVGTQRAVGVARGARTAPGRRGSCAARLSSRSPCDDDVLAAAARSAPAAARSGGAGRRSVAPVGASSAWPSRCRGSGCSAGKPASSSALACSKACSGSFMAIPPMPSARERAGRALWRASCSLLLQIGHEQAAALVVEAEVVDA